MYGLHIGMDILFLIITAVLFWLELKTCASTIACWYGYEWNFVLDNYAIPNIPSMIDILAME